MRVSDLNAGPFACVAADILLAKPSPRHHQHHTFNLIYLVFFRKDLVYVAQADLKLMVILLP